MAAVTAPGSGVPPTGLGEPCGPGRGSRGWGRGRTIVTGQQGQRGVTNEGDVVPSVPDDIRLPGGSSVIGDPRRGSTFVRWWTGPTKALLDAVVLVGATLLTVGGTSPPPGVG